MSIFSGLPAPGSAVDRDFPNRMRHAFGTSGRPVLGAVLSARSNSPYRGILSTVSEPTDASAQIEFRHLVETWREERGATSSIMKMVICPSYQRIIGMGEKAVSPILRQLEEEGDDPDMWFWALQMITGQNPVHVAAQGDMRAMADAWLDWAETRYVW